jgi:hypothetical protein
MAHALDIVSKDVYAELEKIKKIRIGSEKNRTTPRRVEASAIKHMDERPDRTTK